MLVWLAVLGAVVCETETAVNFEFAETGWGLPIVIREHSSSESTNPSHGKELGLKLELQDVASHLESDAIDVHMFPMIDGLCHHGYWVAEPQHRIDGTSGFPIRIERDDNHPAHIPRSGTGLGWLAFCDKWDIARALHAEKMLGRSV